MIVPICVCVCVFGASKFGGKLFSTVEEIVGINVEIMPEKKLRWLTRMRRCDQIVSDSCQTKKNVIESTVHKVSK